MQYSKGEKAMWLEDWRGSGKTAWVYAKENGLVPQTGEVKIHIPWQLWEHNLSMGINKVLY